MAASEAAGQVNKIDPKTLSLTVKKAIVKELPKQANGTFVAAPFAPDPAPSPRTHRANKAKALETKDENVIYKLI